jgi:hypothetical protein
VLAVVLTRSAIEQEVTELVRTLRRTAHSRPGTIALAPVKAVETDQPRAGGSMSRDQRQDIRGAHRDRLVTIIACRPVELPPEMTQLLLEIKIYPGSAVMQCRQCQTDIYVGPRQQEALEASASMLLLCMLCAITRTATETTLVTHLDNDFERRPRGHG